MVCVQDFNQENYLSGENDIWKEAIHNGCFSAVSLSFAGQYLHHADMGTFFSALAEDKGRKEPAAGLKPGLEGFSEILVKHGLEWDGDEYGPREFLYTFTGDSFALCGFYRKENNIGHAIAIFMNEHPASDSIYIFDPNHGLFRGNSEYTLFDHIEYFLLKQYPDIDPRRVMFRNVRRVL